MLTRSPNSPSNSDNPSIPGRDIHREDLGRTASITAVSPNKAKKTQNTQNGGRIGQNSSSVSSPKRSKNMSKQRSHDIYKLHGPNKLHRSPSSPQKSIFKFEVIKPNNHNNPNSPSNPNNPNSPNNPALPYSALHPRPFSLRPHNPNNLGSPNSPIQSSSNRRVNVNLSGKKSKNNSKNRIKLPNKTTNRPKTAHTGVRDRNLSLSLSQSRLFSSPNNNPHNPNNPDNIHAGRRRSKNQNVSKNKNKRTNKRRITRDNYLSPPSLMSESTGRVTIGSPIPHSGSSDSVMNESESAAVPSGYHTSPSNPPENPGKPEKGLNGQEFKDYLSHLKFIVVCMHCHPRAIRVSRVIIRYDRLHHFLSVYTYICFYLYKIPL